MVQNVRVSVCTGSGAADPVVHSEEKEGVCFVLRAPGSDAGPSLCLSATLKAVCVLSDPVWALSPSLRGTQVKY